MSTEKSRRRRRLSAEARREVIERAATEVFAERGYRGASIDEIARRSGVSPPVVYDHFASKQELHARLLERTRDELLAVWREHLAGDEAAEVRIPRAFDAWARYIETNPYAARMFFRESTGEPEAEAIHRQVRAQAQGALGAIVGRAGEPLRAGLAVWWSEHPHVPREQIVAVAVNVLWLGFERVSRGERWEP